jgi:hypothetical protein
MTGAFKYEKMIRYPHFRPEETLIWNRFIDKYPDRFESVDYDVKVGTPRDYSMYPEDEIRKALEYLSLKRIDVVGYSMDKAFIIEIEPNANVRAIGEVIAKTDLFKEQFPDYRAYYPMIITDIENPDMRKLCTRYGIIFEVV